MAIRDGNTDKTVRDAAIPIVMALFLIACVVNVLQLTSSIYAMQIYDRVLTSRSEATLLALTLLAVGLVAMSGVLEVCRSFALVGVNRWADARWSRRIFDALFAGVPAAATPGSQALRDFDTVRNFLLGPGLAALLDVPFIPVFLFFLFVIHPSFGVLGLTAVIGVVGAAAWQAALSTRGLAEASAANVRAYGFLDAALRNADATEAMGMREAVFRRWSAHHDAMTGLQQRTSRIAALFSTGIKGAQTIIAGILTLGIGALLAIEQLISPGTLIVASFVLARALGPGLQAVGLWQQGVAALAAHRRLQAFLEQSPQAKEAMPLPVPEGRLQAERLFVTAPGGRPILQGVEFALEPGESVAVVGPSAAGKTTLARALLGVMPPRSGVVRLDGADMALMPREQIGPHAGYLPQSVELFEGTVAENIARLGEADPAAVVDAARTAGVHDMILRLPEGYDTKLGPGGMGLSPGQRQRIGLARAVYGGPRLVVLDEPDSNLDADGQTALLAALRTLRTRRTTTVVVSHRPAVLAEVDKVLVLQEGRVVRFAPRAEVVRGAPASVVSASQVRA